jgi:hypothetical protein
MIVELTKRLKAVLGDPKSIDMQFLRSYRIQYEVTKQAPQILNSLCRGGSSCLEHTGGTS